ncbi:putative Hsp20/alpha crystallin family protein [Candidatus Nitrosotenuis uzonensis]|uniref:Hsp20/alpha crystallin family protein n=2 Tax=Candidatus Nitrosotenuis uzonensis TaxID=1407055 RepID=V6AVV5_9ARCH|nr:putative Hsp20/alpha crystallin family protein [Candidatus Nitrosotenuis uzonensis]
MGLLAVIIKLSKFITKNGDLDKMGIVNYMAKEVAKEIGNKSREFYEFVLPPVDMYLEDDSLIAVIDLPGFDKKDIRLTLNKNILSVTAEKHETRTENPVYKQRPRVIDKKIPLPVQVKDDDVISAKLVQGVLTLRIPIVKNGKQISIE